MTAAETPRAAPRESVLGSRFTPYSLAEGVHVVATQGNSLVVETARGVVFVDSGNAGQAALDMIEDVRKMTDRPVRAVVYSHGHVGYNSGVSEWNAHCEARGDELPVYLAHRNVPVRQARYTETRPFQNFMNKFQFPSNAENIERITPMFAPTDVFDDQFVFDDDERPVVVRWSPSETDDCVSLWLPEQRILWAGPAVIHGFPNIGTPQRICRDTRRWIDTLDAMLELDAEILIPEFGEITRGADEVRDRLQTTRDALQWLVDETMTRINRGMTDVEIIHDITLPPKFTDPPYLRSNYGAPEYVIRDLFREQSGWWTSRNPTDLHPLHPDDAAAAIRSVVDADVVLATARLLIGGDQHQAAMHVLDLIAMAPDDAPEITEARELKAQCCDHLASRTTIYVSKSMYRSSAALLRRGLRRWSEAVDAG
jgi:alkyl sulfatase BDS1-like metallo-beta-lactamase superfamily hydrolase